ncbi:hypothetical protein [Cupriavidus lacunae]|uniref:Uncharacterized protein n=1 Tax=Cupriavidus lacunae TaxID=2666307 RepID=A0A370NHA7_9BURK|nr:hypothetical protein [Cupriavidus lacunae]RDK05002.1 hypothetical protein DN412_39445 [Cupriavidus lacunae]
MQNGTIEVQVQPWRNDSGQKRDGELRQLALPWPDTSSVPLGHTLPPTRVDTAVHPGSQGCIPYKL